MCESPLLVDSTPQNGTNADRLGFYAPRTRFAAISATRVPSAIGPQWVQNRSSSTIYLTKRGPGTLVVPVDVL